MGPTLPQLYLDTCHMNNVSSKPLHKITIVGGGLLSPTKQQSLLWDRIRELFFVFPMQGKFAYLFKVSHPFAPRPLSQIGQEVCKSPSDHIPGTMWYY